MYKVLIKETNQMIRGTKGQELAIKALNKLDADTREIIVWYLHHGYDINCGDVYISKD